jgi:hypothetical protein
MFDKSVAAVRELIKASKRILAKSPRPKKKPEKKAPRKAPAKALVRKSKSKAKKKK